MDSASALKSNHNAHHLSWAKNTNLLFALFLIIVSLSIRLWCLGAHQLLVEEAYYWNYAQHLDWSYLDHPPMVALLIKISTLIFGTHEFSVRIPALLCWGIAALFSFKLTELIHRGSGINAVLVLSLLPFYFVESTIMTPDQPVLACWSAALYYFYRVFMMHEPKSWYKAGICIGLGMVSKYTIVLLGPTVLFYLITVPSARYWLTRKEPYLCALIALCLFTPVIYWNAMHDWVSFVFQSTRRFKLVHHSTFHHFIGLVLLFLLPNGVIGLYLLLRKKYLPIHDNTRWFLQVFTLFPLFFFGMYSMTHAIKMDWIGPGLISIVPWFAFLLSKSSKFRQFCHIGSLFLIPCYLVFISFIAFGISHKASTLFFRKFISWENLTEQFNEVARNNKSTQGTKSIFVPLDVYNIGSELAFYQTKLFEAGKIKEIYPILGSHILGRNSLMYQYWGGRERISKNNLILISTNLKDFEKPSIQNQTEALTPTRIRYSRSQGSGLPVQAYYYRLAQMK